MERPPPGPIPHFWSSTETDKLEEQMRLLQEELEPVEKDGMNPHLGKPYTTLTALMKALRPLFSKYKIGMKQFSIHSDDGKKHLLTRFWHASQWIMTEDSLPLPRQDPQGAGTAISYLKRYDLAAAVGAVSDEDDDGNAASGRGNKENNQQRDSAPRNNSKPPAAAKGGPSTGQGPKTAGAKPGGEAKPKTSTDQIKRMFAIAKKNKWTEVQLREVLKLSSKGTVTSFSDLDKKQYDWLCAAIDGRTYQDVVKEFGG